MTVRTFLALLLIVVLVCLQASPAQAGCWRCDENAKCKQQYTGSQGKTRCESRTFCLAFCITECALTGNGCTGSGGDPDCGPAKECPDIIFAPETVPNGKPSVAFGTQPPAAVPKKPPEEDS